MTAFPKHQHRGKRWITSEDIWGFFFVLPVIIGLVFFQLIPFIFGLTVSLTRWTQLTQPPVWVGLQNYLDLFRVKFPFSFGKALGNTLYFVASVPIGGSVSLLLALLVNQRLRGIQVFRVTYFLPMVTALTAVALVWHTMYQPRFGLINYLLGLLGIQGPRWLADPRWFKPAIVLMTIWKGSGWGMMIFLAGLQGIPAEYYEAALVDGANRWHQFWRITLPLLTPHIFFVVIMLINFSFQTFEPVYVMGGVNGGPLSSGATVVLYVYQNAFDANRYGLGAAAAYVLFAIIMAITFIQFQVQNRWVFYDN